MDAIGHLDDQGVAARKVAVLGTMLELGDQAERLHREVLRDARSRELDLVVATGACADAARHDTAGENPEEAGAGQDDRLITADDWRTAYPLLRERLEGNEVVLLKASRGIALEGILPLLQADFAPGIDPVEA